jgi:hypothetical protein
MYTGLVLEPSQVGGGKAERVQTRRWQHGASKRGNHESTLNRTDQRSKVRQSGPLDCPQLLIT